VFELSENEWRYRNIVLFVGAIVTMEPRFNEAIYLVLLGRTKDESWLTVKYIEKKLDLTNSRN